MAQAATKTPAPAAKAPAQPAEAPKVQGVTRREFLYYIWGASIALALAETAGAVIWYILPVFKQGEFGAPYPIDVNLIPAVDSGPSGFPALRFWLVNLGDKEAPKRAAREQAQTRNGQSVVQGGQKGILALYTVCTHLGCLYKWVDTNFRFECPCHGSKYNLNGTYIEGPTPRNLDRMILEMKDAQGNTLAATDKDFGEAIPLPDGTAQIVVQTGKIVRGVPHG